jgi:Transglutaminase-like superfamily
MGRLLKFWSLTRREKKFFFEAGILVLLSNFCIKTIAFRHIYSFLGARWKDDTQGYGTDRADDIMLINLSVQRTANLLPSKSLCLSRSIAEFIMLRRRGIPAVLFAGVNVSEDSSLDAHAWIDIGLGVKDRSSKDHLFTAVVKIGQDLSEVDSGRDSLR